VIVTGASNVEGKCDDRDAAPALLEALLRKRLPQDDVEVLNAACAGYTFYNFLAVLEQYAELQPDVFCLVAYGGNDFFGNLKFERWFERRLPPRYEPYGTAALEASDDDFLRQLVGVEVGQAAYYLNNPEGEQLSIDSALRGDAGHGAPVRRAGHPLRVRLPASAAGGQPAYLAEERRRALQLVGLEEGALEVSGRIADAWIEYCAQIGIDVIDLRPRFLEADERLYWKADIHINLRRSTRRGRGPLRTARSRVGRGPGLGAHVPVVPSSVRRNTRRASVAQQRPSAAQITQRASGETVRARKARMAGLSPRRPRSSNTSAATRKQAQSGASGCLGQAGTTSSSRRARSRRASKYATSQDGLGQKKPPSTKRAAASGRSRASSVTRDTGTPVPPHPGGDGQLGPVVSGSLTNARLTETA
jgi:hypothetical protein